MVNAQSPASQPTHPWPHSLPQQTTPTLSFYSHHLSLYHDLRAFTEQRAQLEREYGNKLKLMVSKLREKELEGRKVVLLTVGEESRKGWQEGLERRNTLLSSLSSHLSTLETISSAHLKLSESLQSQIIDEFKKSVEKKESSRKRLCGWVDEVVGENERVEGDREKAMNKYHQSHQDLLTAKQKHSKASRDDTHLPRLLKTYKTALVGKNCAKNDYLLKVGVSRRVGEVWGDTTEVEQDGARVEEDEEEEEANKFGPGVARCQDEVQRQYVSSVKRVNDLLSYTSTIYSGFYTAQARYSDGIIEAHTKVDGSIDADLFADWNTRSEPSDTLADHSLSSVGLGGSKATFVPCPGHPEEPRITLGETDSLGFDEPGGSAGLGPADLSLARGKGEEIIVLQNRLAKNREMKNKLEAACFGWNKEVGRQRKVIRSCEANRGLGDPDEVVEAMMITLKDLSLAELRLEALNVEIDLLEEALGNDQGAQKPHDFEKASFAIPTPCDCCKSSIWGITKPGSSCCRCGSNVHVKCANKVPAECPGGSPTHTPTPSKRMSSMFPRRESSSISDLASIASGRDREESSLRAIRRSFTSRVKQPSSDQSSMATLANLSNSNGSGQPTHQPILPPPHKMTDMDNLDTTGIVQMNGLGRLQTASQPILTSPIQREIGTGRRISMFGSPTGGTGLPPANGIISPIASPSRRRSADVLGGFRASPGGSPVIEEEGEEFRPFGRGPQPGGGMGQMTPPAIMARVLFDFEAADDDELTVEKGTMVTVLEPDDGQGWIKVRTRLADGSLEGLVPAGYVEIQPSPPPASQSQTQQPTRNGTPSSLATGYTTPPEPGPGLAPSFVPGGYPSASSPNNQGSGAMAAPGFPFSTPRIPGGFVSSLQSPHAPSTPAGPRPPGPTRGMYGQVVALYDYQAAESDEITLVKGRTYDLSVRGRGYDAGWWELFRPDGGEVGTTGIAPSNYLKGV